MEIPKSGEGDCIASMRESNDKHTPAKDFSPPIDANCDDKSRYVTSPTSTSTPIPNHLGDDQSPIRTTPPAPPSSLNLSPIPACDNNSPVDFTPPPPHTPPSPADHNDATEAYERHSSPDHSDSSPGPLHLNGSPDDGHSPPRPPLLHFPLSVDGSRVQPIPVVTQTDFAVAAARSAWIFVSTLYAIAAYLLWFGGVLLPLRFVAPALYWRMEAQIFRFLQSPVAHWMMTAGYTVEEVGDDIGSLENDEVLLLPNHQSTGDVPTIMMSLMNKPSACGRVLWIISSTFRYTHFGICSLLRGDFFISAGKQKREKQLISLSRHVDDVYSRHYRKWMILFPEGGFFRKRKANSQRSLLYTNRHMTCNLHGFSTHVPSFTSTCYAKKSNFPVLEYCALPRLGALQTITDLMHPHLPERPEVLPNGMKYRSLKWIVDMTIGYPGQKPLDFFNVTFANRPPCKTTIHYRIYKASDVPVDHTQLRDWLFARYVEKDYLLSEFYKTGSFPASDQATPTPTSSATDSSSPSPSRPLEPLVPRPVEIDSDWLTAIHAFFVSSLAVQIFLIYRLYCLVF